MDVDKTLFLLIRFFNSHDFILLYRTLILLIFFRKKLNFIKILCNSLILLEENYLDKTTGASPCLALCYPLHGIGSGIGGSLRASLRTSPMITLLVSIGIRYKGSLLVSIGCRLGGSRGDRLSCSIGVSLQGSPWARLGDSPTKLLEE